MYLHVLMSGPTGLSHPFLVPGPMDKEKCDVLIWKYQNICKEMNEIKTFN